MRDIYESKRLYRDTLRGKICGVCAGVARYWQVDPWLIRAAAVLCFLMLPTATAIAYLLAVIVIRSR